MDGGDRHPLVQGERLGRIDALMRAGVGLACLHYAVVVPRARGGAELLRWLGGYYETGYSTNPHWVAEFKTLPEHPITRGVRPFALQDEWYFNLRFAPGGSGGLTPILRATPPDSVRKTAAAREHPGREEVVAWALERPDHGRAFGFTGGHTHRNWGDENFRRLVLNAIVWIAGGEVPPEGVSSSVSDEELGRNLDAKPVK
jgi:type 1 glutamine amidotransferase